MERPQQKKKAGVVVDGSEMRELVENKEAFAEFVEQKFRQLDGDGDGRLSVRELQPAVADIGAAIGLPARGSSPQADHIYSEEEGKLSQSEVVFTLTRLVSLE